jgi:hypothetical protein
MSPRDINPGCHSLPLGNEPRWWRMPYKIREAGIRSAHGLHPSTLYNSGFVGNGTEHGIEASFEQIETGARPGM